MIFRLERSYTEIGTFGKLYDPNNAFICYTIEKPWENNEPFNSCVPEGTYELKNYNSPTYGPSIALYAPTLNIFVNQVDDRARFACLFHAANTASELAGCIAPGDRLGVVRNEWAVMNSKNTLRKLPLQEGDELIIRS